MCVRYKLENGCDLITTNLNSPATGTLPSKRPFSPMWILQVYIVLTKEQRVRG